MDIYLMQHGQAHDKATDPDRHLNEEGLNAVGRVASRALTLVGQLPLLERLAAALIGGNEDRAVIAFENAGLVRLVPDPRRRHRYLVRWILTPGLC